MKKMKEKLQEKKMNPIDNIQMNPIYNIFFQDTLFVPLKLYININNINKYFGEIRGKRNDKQIKDTRTGEWLKCDMKI